MQIQQLLDKCNAQINMLGENAQVGLVMPGMWGKKDTKRLIPGGPIGRITAEFDGEVYGYKGSAVHVFFSAAEVKKACEKALGEEQQ
ncbi:hypothetical protein T3H97_16435 [Paenibacillus sp. LX16]|uniref:hypothetical protein n=1 Tax=Paenibacillus sp. LX16 TaxID=1740264 RepID=UPI002E2C40DA|nr:hypothetical protein [Paenibacillus sp. LX16]